MAEWDITRITAATDELLRTVENPRHRAILGNYRRHALLEVSGRYEEILTPAMTVAHPVYRLTEGPHTIVLDGHDQVREFYAGLVAAGAIVMGRSTRSSSSPTGASPPNACSTTSWPGGCSWTSRTSTIPTPRT
jgi:hypothetical protein